MGMSEEALGFIGMFENHLCDLFHRNKNCTYSFYVPMVHITSNLHIVARIPPQFAYQTRPDPRQMATAGFGRWGAK